jgi:hypothetical protein
MILRRRFRSCGRGSICTSVADVSRMMGLRMGPMLNRAS